MYPTAGSTAPKMTTLTTAVATPCPGVNGPAVYLIGVVNNSLSAQTATILVYDNASAASGAVAASIGPLGISQVITFPGPGIPLANGATAIASAAPNGAGVQVLTR
jgi:hypothetical protein